MQKSAGRIAWRGAVAGVCALGLVAPASAVEAPSPRFDAKDRAVDNWRVEAADHLTLSADQIADLRSGGSPPAVARCVKLNNYWCIKKAGWNGEIAADREGHVAFASAVEGAAVAALLLKRYYVDFGRRSAVAIISHWAPALCGGLTPVVSPGLARRQPKASPRLAGTLRGRWLAGHARGFVTPLSGRKAKVKQSVVADRHTRPMAAPTIAVGLGETSRPMTLDALLQKSPGAPPSRSMLGMPRGRGGTRTAGLAPLGSISGCATDRGRIAAYAAKAQAGITVGTDGDLVLFDKDGAPTPNLTTMMTNMARVEIGPLGVTPQLVAEGIADGLKAGRNPDKS